MENILNIFNDDAFSAVELTKFVERLETVPSFISDQNLFEPHNLRTRDAGVYGRDGTLALVKTSPDGAPPEELDLTKGTLRKYRTPRLAKGSTINAYELQGLLAFDRGMQLKEAMKEVADRQQKIGRLMDLTRENMQLGALHGKVKDADGSIIVDWYDEWGIAEPAEINFSLNVADTDVRKKCHEVRRLMRRSSKGSWTPQTRVNALVGDEFFDDLIKHPSVVKTYEGWSAAVDLRKNIEFDSFPFGGILWHNYQGTDDNVTVAVDPNKARFYPSGAMDVFQVGYGPAEFFPYVNMQGQKTTSLLITDKDRQAWVRPEQYSYPLYICTRPEMLLRAKKA